MIVDDTKIGGSISVWTVSLWLMAIFLSIFLISCGESRTISTSVEFVSYGCKKLALSAPFTDDDIDVLLEHAQQKAEEHGIPIYVEKELLVTPLFNPRVAEGKIIILFAFNQDVLDEYMALKEFKRRAVEEGRLEEDEEEIAWRFGRLLSYTDEAIERLQAENKDSFHSTLSLRF